MRLFASSGSMKSWPPGDSSPVVPNLAMGTPYRPPASPASSSFYISLSGSSHVAT